MRVRAASSLSSNRYERGQRERQRQRKLHRALSRCRQGSRNRGLRKATLARLARKELVREWNACHRATTEIIRKHGLIAFERLKIRNMTWSGKGTAEEPGSNVKAKAGLNWEVLAQNWSLLQNQLKYKAEWPVESLWQ